MHLVQGVQPFTRPRPRPKKMRRITRTITRKVKRTRTARGVQAGGIKAGKLKKRKARGVQAGRMRLPPMPVRTGTRGQNIRDLLKQVVYKGRGIKAGGLRAGGKLSKLIKQQYANKKKAQSTLIGANMVKSKGGGIRAGGARKRRRPTTRRKLFFNGAGLQAGGIRAGSVRL